MDQDGKITYRLALSGGPRFGALEIDQTPAREQERQRMRPITKPDAGGAFGDWLRSLRQENGISQQQLGQMLPVTGRTIGHWERGESRPRNSHLESLAALTETSVEEMVAMLDERDGDTPDEAPREEIRHVREPEPASGDGQPFQSADELRRAMIRRQYEKAVEGSEANE